MINFRTTTESKSKLINRRMFILSSAKLVVFSGIFGRLFYLQISENIKYMSLSEKNRLREWKLPPQRGVIEDYFGTKIADNTQVYQLHLIPENVLSYNQLFFRLKKIINMSDKDIAQLKKVLKSQKPWEPVIVSDNLSWAEFSRLNLFLHEIPGIQPLVSVARNYPADGSSSHVIGYVSAVSKADLNKDKFIRDVHVAGLRIGKIGLERALNKTIIGLPGYQRYEVNAFGKKIREIKSVSGKTGKNFKTTLDNEVQKFASELLIKKNGSISVMDIYTGDIVAMVSSPTFNSNKFVHGISTNDWKKLLDDPGKPLINKAISGLYPPGSTIKPIVALSALENDVISPKFTVKCEGKIELYGQKYHCWKEKGHGFLNLRKAIKESCDVYFYEMSRRLGVDRLSITAKNFGLGSRVLNSFKEEKVGIVPNTKWKLNNIGKGWVLGETLITGIGQGYFQTTPIQICLMTAQLANGGYKIIPRIIDDRDSIKPILNAWKENLMMKNESEKLFSAPTIVRGNYLQPLFRNPENIKFVTEALFGATNEFGGTSYASRYNKSKYIYAGKTGTSQVRRYTEEQRELKIKYTDLPFEHRDHALFAAFFPYKKPRYAISVVIEHGGSGSSVAAPIAKKVIKKVIDRHQQRSSLQEDIFKEI